MSRVGRCRICNHDAAFNTPCIVVDLDSFPRGYPAGHFLDKDTPITCNVCVTKTSSPIPFQGIEQITTSDGNLVTIRAFYYRTICLMEFPSGLCCWRDNGSTSFKLSPEERKIYDMDGPFVLANYIVSNNIFRCCQCGKDTPESNLKRGLFAEVLCPGCKDKRDKMIDKEYDQGNTCLLCGKARSECTC